jgi:hypothetical protein
MNESNAKPPKSVSPKQRQYIVYGGILTVACCISFVAGVLSQKGHNDNTLDTQTGTTSQYGTNNQLAQGMGAGRMRGGAFGTVTAISETSITIDDQRQGTEATYTITSDTTISDSGTTATISDIAEGDTVMIAPDPSDSGTAATINLGAPTGVPRGYQDSTDNNIQN